MSETRATKSGFLVEDAEGVLLDDDFLAKIDQLQMISRKIISGKIHGERLTKKRGQSAEFADYRQYVPGDDLRMIDWNIYGRLERLFLKLFLEEEELHVRILIDVSGSMSFGKPSKLFYAKRIAAALAYIALSEYDRVVIGAYSEGFPTMMPSLRGKRNMMRILDFLARLEGGGLTSSAQCFRNFAMAHRNRGILIVLSDCFDKGGHEDAFKYLLANNDDCFVIQVLSPEELQPELAGDLTLVDVEDGDATDITISAPLLATYKKNLGSFISSIKDYCSRRAITHVLAPTSLPFDTLIVDYLRRRGMLK
jgi:uncharacterized protein (DUF58 family)